MKALRYYNRHDFRLEDVAEPDVGPDDVKIRVKWCGICGSDVHEFLAGPQMIPFDRPHPGTGRMAPIIGGHEFSGEVVDVGERVSRVGVGDRVTVRPTLPCYRCHYCRRGQHIQCVILGTIGASTDGAFAEFVTVPEDTVYELPPDVSFEAGAYVEPLACALHAVRRSGMVQGATAAVIGAGPIGLLTLQAALACGAEKVIVFETLERRREMAERLGACAALNPLDGNPGKEIARLTDGLRADPVFECAGKPAAMLLADQVSGRGATIVEVGVMMETCDFPFLNLFMREKSIIASQGYVDEFPTAIAYLASGRVKCDPEMTTARIALSNIMEEGFHTLAGAHGMEHCKILVTPEG